MKTVFVDMDNVLVNFPAAIEQLDRTTLDQFSGRLDEVPGIFSLMPPMDGALAAYETIAGNYDTYVLSTAPWENPTAWSDKLLWVKRHLGQLAHKRLILSHNKHLCVGDYLIDDRTKNGAGQFTGELILFGSEAFPDWKSVVRYLLD